jgi:hypothetical protein
MMKWAMQSMDFFIKFTNEEKFLDYFYKNWVVGDKISKCNTFLCISIFVFHKDDIFTNSFFILGMWVKGCQRFSHANQETNNVIESYHCYLKTNFYQIEEKNVLVGWIGCCISS